MTRDNRDIHTGIPDPDKSNKGMLTIIESNPFAIAK
jgi:hypothetical protein